MQSSEGVLDLLSKPKTLSKEEYKVCVAQNNGIAHKYQVKTLQVQFGNSCGTWA